MKQAGIAKGGDLGFDRHVVLLVELDIVCGNGRLSIRWLINRTSKRWSFWPLQK